MTAVKERFKGYVGHCDGCGSNVKVPGKYPVLEKNLDKEYKTFKVWCKDCVNNPNIKKV